MSACLAALLLAVVSGCAAEEPTAMDGGFTADASASALDGAQAPGADAAPSAVGEIPDGMVPLAIGQANGRLVTSCDRGQSWSSELVMDAEADDHSEYAGKGLAFGNGIFVAVTGWGVPEGHVLRSTNGVDWDDLDASHFTRLSGTPAPPASISLVFFDGTQFGLVSSRHFFLSPDGEHWTEQALEFPYELFHWRSSTYVPEQGVLFVRGENVNKTVQWLIRSEDSGASYAHITEGDGFDFRCTGRMSYREGVLVSAGTEVVCRSTDAGQSWTVVETLPGDGINTIIPTEDGFAGFRTWRSSVAASADGSAWEALEPVSGMKFGGAGRAPQGYYVASDVATNTFYRSDDGRNWGKLADGDVPASGPAKSFQFGYGEPSASCPL